VTEDVADSLGLARNRGELVQTVQPGQAAAAAGLQPGDVVVKVDNKEVAPDNTLSFIVANTAPGKRIPIEVIRNGKRLTLNATVGKRPSEEELAKQSFGPSQPNADDRFNRAPEKQGEGLAERALGLSVLPMNPQIAGQIGLPADTRGLVISVVDGSSDAGSKGLQRGDVILSANYRDVLTVADLEAIIRAAKAENRAAVLLRVQRRGQPAAYLPVRLR
jgi:serine protease Do